MICEHLGNWPIHSAVPDLFVAESDITFTSASSARPFSRADLPNSYSVDIRIDLEIDMNNSDYL